MAHRIRVWPFYSGFRLSVSGARYSVDRYGIVRTRLKTRRDELGKPVWSEVGRAKAIEIRSMVTRETGEIPMTWKRFD